MSLALGESSLSNCRLIGKHRFFEMNDTAKIVYYLKTPVQ
jgi:hypothetical protein